MTTGKTIALTRRTFVSKVTSLLFNKLSRLIIAFLPKTKRLLISWLQITIFSDFGAQENKVCHCFHCFSIYLPQSDGGTGCHDLSILADTQVPYKMTQDSRNPCVWNTKGSTLVLAFLPTVVLVLSFSVL